MVSIQNSVNDRPDANRTQHAIAIFGASGALADGGPLTDGQLLIGSTGAAPAAATLSAGAGINVTNAAGAITITATGGGMSWVEAVADVTPIAVNTGYITKHATPATRLNYTLPAVAAQGATFEFLGYTAGGWQIVQVANQQIFFGNTATTIGVGGYLASTLAKDSVTIVCVTANLEFEVVASIGNITVA